MERVRIGVEASEIIDFDAPFFLFPVRHHSPVCSYHLKSVIKRYRPEIILIEGPENANDLIPVLTDERTSLPAAIYYYYKDKKKYISDDAQDYKCYYPFLYSSPEYNAIKAAKELGIKAEFIDLPYSEILINTAKGRGLLENEKRTIADDTKLAKGDFYKALCDKTGIRDFDEFWEKYFEISGLFESDEEFLAALHTYCLISRRQTSTEEMTADATLAREEYMAANISEALKVHKKVLVVTGGFHSYGLYERLKRGGEFKKKKLHIVPADCTGCFPAAYSYEAADAMKGYSSGMRAPFFYDSVYRKLEESADELNIPLHKGLIHSSDVFYRQSSDYLKTVHEKGCVAVEMESFALFSNAKVLHKNAACILTISDSFVSDEITTPEQRQTSFTNMMKIALNAAVK